ESPPLKSQIFNNNPHVGLAAGYSCFRQCKNCVGWSGVLGHTSSQLRAGCTDDRVAGRCRTWCRNSRVVARNKNEREVAIGKAGVNEQSSQTVEAHKSLRVLLRANL